MIHECLKRGWCIAETEEHDGGFESPMGVMKAAFHWSSSRMQMLLYPQRMSNLVNKVDSFMSLISSGIRGSG